MKQLLALYLAVMPVSSMADAPDLTQSEGHALYHEYYKYWYNGRGTHCCNDQHCRPAKFRYHDGAWQVEIAPDQWYTWQYTDQVRDDLGLGPFGSVCAEGDHVYCVDPPDAGI